MNAAVFLSVLKVIGIVILIVLAIFLALILLIIFVPIRYRLIGSWKADRDIYDFRLDITWFLHLLHGKAWFIRNKESGNNEEGYGHELKVLWFQLIPGKDEDYTDDYTVDHPDDLYPVSTEYSGTGAGTAESGSYDHTAPSYSSDQDNGYMENVTYESIDEPERKFDQEKEDEEIHIPERFSDRLKEFISFLKNLIKKIKRTGKRAGYKIRSICDKIRELFEKAGYYKDLFGKESTEKALILLRDEVLFKLKVLKPVKYRLNMLYGFDDPALTGEVTGALSLVFLSCGKNVTFTPDFDQKVLEGDIFMRGGIKIITLLIILWKLYFNKDFREFYRAVRR
ncbi:MAG: DUF2953 domain-containing protein [Lachnospiraceae bacterium]|nr:DUF2953 domain-containing protein [Lachnospiraceae bacterium]